MNNIMAEKLKIKIPEGFGPKENCVACNGTGTKYLISLFNGQIYYKREGRCHCLRRVDLNFKIERFRLTRLYGFRWQKNLIKQTSKTQSGRPNHVFRSRCHLDRGKEQCEIKKRRNIMYKYQEKRKYKRIKRYERSEKPYMARFKIRSDKAQEMEAYDWNSILLMNISAGGAAFFYNNKDLGIGTLLDLKIDVFESTPAINCVGKIIRIDKTLYTSLLFGIAIKYTEIGEQEKEKINTTIEALLESRIKVSSTY